MLIRTISSVAGLLLWIFIVMQGSFYIKYSMLILILLGMREFYKAMNTKAMPIQSIGYLCSIVTVIFAIPNNKNIIIEILIFSMITLFFILIFYHNKYNILDISVTLTGYTYICLLFCYILFIRYMSYGDLLIWLVFISAWGSDTGAYIIGCSLGKHKLCPVLSPKKTVEGSIGGIIFSTTLSYIYGIILIKLNLINISNFGLICILIGFVGGIFSQLGDLLASSIKRYTNIKDYGKILPGHGGVLDRFDSVLFTAPVVYYILLLVIK